MIQNVVIAGAARTPMGGFLGALADVPAPQLGATAITAALDRARVDPKAVQEVFMGNVLSAGNGQSVARQCMIHAGIPPACGAVTVNKMCGSGLQTIKFAAQGIQCGDVDLVVAGGTESMTRAPYLLPRARAGLRLGHGEVLDALLTDGLLDAYGGKHMGQCAEMCVKKYGFTRDEQDAFAIESFKRAIAAEAAGHFKHEIAPVTIAGRKGTVTVEKDEDIGKFNEAKLRQLRPAFEKEGTITAGNASSISDGAAAVVVMSEAKARSLGVKPIARVLGYATAGLEPEWFSIAPSLAIRKLSDRIGLPLAKVDLFEINEAFAAVALAALKDLELSADRVNVHGGAVALGHPIGASGTRIVVTLLNALRIRGKKLGIACACIGGGEASAIAFERIE